VNHQEYVIKEVTRIWAKWPELRLGQLIANSDKILTSTDLFYISDDDLVATLQKLDRWFEAGRKYEASMNCVERQQNSQVQPKGVTLSNCGLDSKKKE
jgi:hypothetical protein